MVRNLHFAQKEISWNSSNGLLLLTSICILIIAPWNSSVNVPIKYYRKTVCSPCSDHVITARKRSCGKVMFLHLSVVLFHGIVGRQTPPLSRRQTLPDTMAGDTHPIGMHTCSPYDFTLVKLLPLFLLFISFKVSMWSYFLDASWSFFRIICQL